MNSYNNSDFLNKENFIADQFSIKYKKAYMNQRKLNDTGQFTSNINHVY